MFMNAGQLEHNNLTWHIESRFALVNAAEAQLELDPSQNLLNAVDAARAGLAFDEHDYDNTEAEVI